MLTTLELTFFKKHALFLSHEFVFFKVNKVDNKIPFVCIIKTIDLSPVCVGVCVCVVRSNGMTLPILSFFPFILLLWWA